MYSEGICDTFKDITRAIQSYNCMSKCNKGYTDTVISPARLQAVFSSIPRIYVSAEFLVVNLPAWTHQRHYNQHIKPHISCLFTAFLTAGGMGVFHGYEYLEKTKIKDENHFYAFWQNNPSYSVLISLHILGICYVSLFCSN